MENKWCWYWRGIMIWRLRRNFNTAKAFDYSVSLAFLRLIAILLSYLFFIKRDGYPFEGHAKGDRFKMFWLCVAAEGKMKLSVLQASSSGSVKLLEISRWAWNFWKLLIQISINVNHVIKTMTWWRQYLGKPIFGCRLICKLVFVCK